MNNQEIDKKLGEFHSWLASEIPGYRALCEDGSYAVGDAWVEGESDRDIAIIIDTPAFETTARIQSYLDASSFSDSCFFTLKSTEEFLNSDKGDTHDLSLKFRGRTLFGEDIVAEKAIPPVELGRKLAIEKLGNIEGKLERRLFNAGIWSADHLRAKTYPIFKNLFLGLAAQHYAETGSFPRKRIEVAGVYQYIPDLGRILKVLETFKEATKVEIVDALRSATAIVRLLAAAGAIQATKDSKRGHQERQETL